MLVPSKFSRPNESLPLPEMNDRNVIYIQVLKRDAAARTDGVVFWIIWGAYHLTEKSGWGVESIMVSDLPVYRRNATSVTV